MFGLMMKQFINDSSSVSTFNFKCKRQHSRKSLKKKNITPPPNIIKMLKLQHKYLYQTLFLDSDCCVLSTKHLHSVEHLRF